MRTRMTGRDLVLAIAAVAALFLLFSGTLPATHERRAGLASLSDAAARIDAIAEQPDQAASALADARAAFGSSPTDASSPVIAAAAAAGLPIVTLAAGETVSTGVTLDGHAVVGTRVEVQMEGATSAVPAFLQAVEGASRLMTVSRVSTEGSQITASLTVYAEEQ